MNRRSFWLNILMLCLATGTIFAQEAKYAFPVEDIPQFNTPIMSKPPVIDGNINADEWKESVKLMGVAWTSSLNYRDRPVSFWVAWDAKHLYIATRSDILPGHRLYRNHREQYTTGVVSDDCYEYGLYLHDRNKLPNEVSSFLKFIINTLGSGEYMKLYPSIGQNMYNWQPNMKIANRIYDDNGKKWWDLELSADLNDLQMPVDNKAGDKIGMLLTAPLKNPGWQWLDYPSATGHLVHYGFPKATLTDVQPYMQIEEFSGLHDEKLHLKSAIYNPDDKPVKVNVSLSIIYDNIPEKKEPPKTIVNEKQLLTIPAKGNVRFDIDKDFPGLEYSFTKWGSPNNSSTYKLIVTPVEGNDSPAIYTFTCKFAGTDKSYLKADPRTLVFEYDMRYNPVSNKIALAGDTLDAVIPVGSKPAALSYIIDKDGKVIKDGKITQYVNYKYEDIVQLPTLEAGKYRVTMSLVDAAGKVLVTRNDATFDKKDEAREFSAWWNNKIGDDKKLLKPFEALKVKNNSLYCTRREYQMNGLGMPKQIIANGGNVFTKSANIIITIGGKEYKVPASGKPTFTSLKDWRIEFNGKSEVAGVIFTVKGWAEQDGLVNIDLTYASKAKSVAIDALRVEWFVDDSKGNWMSCIGGTGGNYSARYIGKVPDGKGPIWNTLDNIGKAGSTMIVGNFESNLWVGNEYRGFLWTADSDQGWVPNDKVPAHSLIRQGKTIVICNNIIKTTTGEKPFILNTPRTIQLQYNATPFRHLAKGWRLTQVSAANGFSAPNYKTNEKTKQEYFSILSMPSTDVKEWPEYYAKYKTIAEGMAKEGYTNIAPRLKLFLTNQIALRGYMDKTTEPGLYGYFGADWLPGDESLNKSYQDYMMYLMNRHIREGGVTHYYFDISFSRDARDLIAGFGYRLPDGQIQPTSMDNTLREWYKRTWALMQENDLYPGGVSGHATNSICLRALPWTDAILDSEYPMPDPITTYPPDRMIAMSHPQTFGVNISHLGFMNPHWASMHDTGAGGSGYPFNSTPFRHFGIAASDVNFIPYWRNGNVVKKIGNGLKASIWKRSNSAVIEIMNYGLDEAGKEKTRKCELTLDLRKLGVPAGIKASQIRISEMDIDKGVISEKYLSQFNWYKEIPDSPHPLGWNMKVKLRSLAIPKLNLKSGEVSGFDIYYHDARFILISWDNKPVSSDTKSLFTENQLDSVLGWGIGRAKLLDNAVAVPNKQVTIQSWTLPGTAMLLVKNNGDKLSTVKIKADLDKLGVKVPKLWQAYTQCIGGDLDAISGEITIKDLKAGESKIVFIDTFAE
ncbi:MAG: glycoside hydrolase domain-containing protein [bacterium]